MPFRHILDYETVEDAESTEKAAVSLLEWRKADGICNRNSTVAFLNNGAESETETETEEGVTVLDLTAVRSELNRRRPTVIDRFAGSAAGSATARSGVTDRSSARSRTSKASVTSEFRALQLQLISCAASLPGVDPSKAKQIAKVKSRLDGQLKQAIALEMEEETSRQAAERQLKEQVKQAKAAADRVQFVAASKKLKETREQFDEQRRKKQVYIEQMRRDHEILVGRAMVEAGLLW